MENQNDPETLVGDLGQAQNPCDKTLELGSGMSGFNFGFNPMSPFESLFGDTDGWLVEEGGGMGGNNVEVSDQSMMDIREGIEVTAEGGEINGLNSQGLQVNSNFDVVEEEGHGSQNNFNPASNHGASEDGISLFAALFGQSNGYPGGEADFGEALNDGLNGALMPETEEVPSSDVSKIQDPVIDVMQSGERKETISNIEFVVAAPETEEVPSSDGQEYQKPVIGVTQNGEWKDAIGNHEAVFTVPETEKVPSSDVPETQNEEQNESIGNQEVVFAPPETEKVPSSGLPKIQDPDPQNEEREEVTRDHKAVFALPEKKVKPSSDVSEDATKSDRAVSDHEVVFAVGDLIWVETKTSIWWPGLISDPSHAPEVATKPDEKFDTLVKCFGNDSYIWCTKSQLKPFFENFEQLSIKSNTKGFISSIEKAVDEFVRRVKLELTCSCNGRSTDMPGNKISRAGETFSTQFEPADFLGFVKDLALRVSVPDVFEYVVTQSRLSAFYRSVGHFQIPVRQLWETNYLNGTVEKPKAQTHHSVLYLRRKLLSPVPKKKKKSLVPRPRVKAAISGNDGWNEEKVAVSEDNPRDDKKVVVSENNGWSAPKTEKSYESRERRRSKYLSPPYVSLAPKDLPISEEIEGDTTVSQAQDTESIADRSVGSASFVKSRGKKSFKKEDLGRKISLSPAEINAASALDMVSEIRVAAIDCLHPERISNFNQLDRFFCMFRRWSFHDETKLEIESNTVQEEVKESTEPLCNMAMIATPDAGQSSQEPNSVDKDVDASAQPLPRVKPKRHRRTKKELEAARAAAAAAASASQNGPGFPDANPNPPKGPFLINFEEGSLVAPDSESMLKKRKIDTPEEAPELLSCNIEVALPDLNGNFVTPSALLQASQPTDATQPQPKKRRRRRTKAEMVAAAAAAANGSGISAISGSSGQELALVNSGANGTNLLNISFSNNQQPINGVPKKRKRRTKEEMNQLKTDVGSSIPDLNGNSSINLGDVNSSGEPEHKRRKRRNIQPAVSGAAIVLRFAPGFPVPSKDAMVATFCGFGPLVESETKALSEPGSAQVVFVNSSGAAEAFQSLEKCSPFGPALVGYNLHHISSSPPSGSGGGKLHVPVTSPRAKSFKVPAKASDPKPQPGESPNLSLIRKNLETMTAMLEKAGDDLSPETRGKLEGEVKSLLKKVSSLVGSSSSSSS